MIANVRIDSIAAGGDGVGRHDNRVVFVPRTAPGDTVRVDIESRGRFSRALPLEIVSPSSERTDPPCEHYTRDACGGCQLQHMNYQSQLAAKQRIVRDSVQRIARREAALPFIRPSDAEWRYRRKLTLAMRRKGASWIAGLHRFDEPGRVFALADCPITQRDVVRVWRDVLAAAEHLPDEGELRGSVRHATGGFAFTLFGARRWSQRDAFFSGVQSIAGLWWKPDGGELHRIAFRGGAEQDEATEAGAAFAQVNAGVAAELHRHVVDRARAHEPVHVVDAYAGTGETASPLAGEGIRVTAIELDAHAAAVGSRRLAPPSRMLVGRTEDHIATLMTGDVILLNPPRAGLDAAVTTALNAADHPRALIYTSCNPGTLARDLTRLDRYRVESLVCFDMFPQTAHVETVCELVQAL